MDGEQEATTILASGIEGRQHGGLRSPAALCPSQIFKHPDREAKGGQNRGTRGSIWDSFFANSRNVEAI